MEHGINPEKIFSLSPDELAVYQAIAELNREQHKQDIKEAVMEACTAIYLKNAKE